MLIAGFDLCSPGGRSVSPDTDHFLVSYCEMKDKPRGWLDPYLEEIRIPLPALMRTLSQPLRLGEESPGEPPLGLERKLIHGKATPYADFLRQLFRQRSIGNFDKVAAAFPYAAPPPIRMALSDALATEASANKKSRVWTSLEAPLAGCLSLLAERRVQPPAKLWLLSYAPTLSVDDLLPGSAGAELTAVEITANATSLTLSVQAWQELHAAPDAPPLSDQLAAWVADRPQTDAGSRILWSLYPDLEPLAVRVAQACNLSDNNVGVAERETVARGVARYAALQLKVPLENTIFRDIKFQRISAHPLCIVGKNHQGELFCRRVLDAGSRLDPPASSSLPVDANGIPHTAVIMLAEAMHPWRRLPLWLPQAAWKEYGLSLFLTSSIGMKQSPKEGIPYQLEIEFNKRSGANVWTADSIKVRLVAP